MTDILVTENLTPDIKGTSIALGFFDGIHSAHKKVLQSAVDHAKQLGTKSVVITFKNHPMELLYDFRYDFITTVEERIEIFKDMGFDVVIMADFTREVASTTAEDYFNNVIMNLEPKSISIGYNHKFGSKKLGDAIFLKNKAQEQGFILDVTERMVLQNASTISSTYIKGLIKAGDMEQVNKLMYKPFSLKNVVISGMRRGRWLGFPTANLEFPKKKIIPHFGVYAGYTIVDGVKHPSIANIGVRPTFADTEKPLTEVNILGFNKNLYDEVIEFQFVKKIRDEIKFPNPDALCSQIILDKKQALAFLNK
ncbi:MAG: riboflavin biosynthesis protein RibF [bacterium]|nr:riboflavin biosynthesis protein RibF [bacterium]